MLNRTSSGKMLHWDLNMCASFYGFKDSFVNKDTIDVFFWRTLSEYTHSIGLAHILIHYKPALEKVSTLDFHTDTDIILY